MTESDRLLAGAAAVEITPRDSQFLYGYPHVRRYSTGVHDPLWSFVGWQGEIFVEYALAVKAKAKDTFVLSLANGELQGYIVTPEAVEQRAYEAGNALFHWSSGEVLVRATLELLAAMER